MTVIVDLAMRALHDVYDETGVAMALNNPRREWDGLNANEMLIVGRSREVYNWAVGLAGGPASMHEGTE